MLFYLIIQSIEPSLEQSMVPFSSNLNNLINYHTMDNRLKSSLYEADMMINTKYEGYKLRLNKFSSWVSRSSVLLLLFVFFFFHFLS